MKTIYSSAVLALILLVLPRCAFSQNTIYKTDGTIMQVDIISVDAKTIIFSLPGDASGKIHYLSISVVDSLTDDSMDMSVFPKNIIPLRRVPRNYIGTDVYNMCFRNLNLTYERLSASGSSGFSAELLINLNTKDYYWGVGDYWNFTNNVFLYYDTFTFFAKFGYSYYPYNYSLNRTGSLRPYTGASLLIGQFRKREWDDYYGELYSKKFAAVVSWNFGAKLFLSDWFLIKADFEVSLIPFLVFNSPEVGIEIGF